MLSDISVPVFGGYLADEAAGVASGQDTFGDIVDNDRPAADDRARADGHTRHHAHHPADPHVVADGDGQRVLEFCRRNPLSSGCPAV